MSLEEIDRAIRVLPARSQNLVLNTLADLLKLDPSLDFAERAPNGVQARPLHPRRELRQDPRAAQRHAPQRPAVRASQHGYPGAARKRGARRSDARIGLHALRRRRRGRRDQHHHRAARPSRNSACAPQSAATASTSSAPRSASPARRSPSSSPSRATSLPASGPTATIAISSFASVTRVAHRLRQRLPQPRLHGPSLRRRPVLRQLQLLGGHQDLVRRRAAGARRQDHRQFLLPPPQRSLRALSRPPGGLHQSPLRRELSGWRAPPRRDVAPPRTLYYGVEALHESIVSNNLGDHARSRAAAYAAPISAPSAASRSPISAREELYRSFSGAFTPTVAGGVWLSPQCEAARLRQPRLPHPQLHRPLLSRPRQPRQSQPAPGERLDLRKRRRLGAQRAHPRRADRFDRRERDGIDYYRTSAHRHLARAEHSEPELQGMWRPACAGRLPSQHRRFPLHATARHAGHHRRRLHQVHVQLSRPRAVFSAGRSLRAAISCCAPGSA